MRPVVTDPMPAEPPTPDAEPIERVRVLQWLLPVVALLIRSQRGSAVARGLAAFDLVVAATLAFAWAGRSGEMASVQSLGARQVPTLGVVVERDPSGLAVTAVAGQGGPGQPGIVVGDVITTIGEHEVDRREALVDIVTARPPGSYFLMKVRREEREVTVAVASAPRWVATEASRARERTMRLIALVIAGAVLVFIAGRTWRARAGPVWVVPWGAALAVAPALVSERPTITAVVSGIVAIAALVTLRVVRDTPRPAAPRRTLWTTLGVVLAAPTLVVRGVALVIAVAFVTDTTILPSMPMAAIASLVLLQSVLAVPVVEEAVFRGIVLPLTTRVVRPWPAVALTSVAFGFLHALGGTNNIWVPTALGFAFGYLRLRTGRLLPCIALHVAWNTITLFV